MFTPLLDVKGISELLNTSPKNIYYWVNRDLIPFIRVGKLLRFEATEVIAYLKQKTDDERDACFGRSKTLKPRRRSLKTRGLAESKPKGDSNNGSN